MRARGFTLVEMAITMAVLALLLMIAMPSIGVWLNNSRIRSATESLQAGLQTARLEAVRRNQNVSLYLVSLSDPNTMDNSCALSSASGSWVISTASPAGKCAGAAALASRPVGDAGGQVRVTAGHSTDNTNKTTLGSSATTVTFNGFGRIANTDTAINRIKITGPSDNTTYMDLMLIVDSGGGVRMCDPRSTIGATDPRKC
ncbi:GspH/FimT family pseudopilin [Variovorax sp. M-6]|uniref:GspH/FimT family pseudopilin n=1 Tax=Variovorax sp. M-6 TaxID=3233041 RepID=UPI003F99DD31